MKKSVKYILTISLFAVILSTMLLSGCQSLSGDEGYDLMQQAIANTLSNDNAHIFYWKESIATPRATSITNLVETTTANVLCTIDRDYNFVKDGSGEYDYDDLKARVTKTYDGKSVYELYCGYAENENSYLAYLGDLNGTTPLNANVEYNFVEGQTAEDYVQSEAFKPYTLAEKLKELKSLKREDLLIEEYENGKVERKGEVTTITCKLSEDYLREYENANGRKSLLDGKYVTIEMAYERISAIIVYQNDPGATGDNNGILALEYESYKFEVVYTGPKFTVPQPK